MIISKEDKKRFLNMVCPGYIRLAKDLINGKIDALYVEYNWYTFGAKTSYGDLGQISIEIFENVAGVVSKIILLNENQSSITDDDIELIRQVTRRYGNRREYDRLIQSDKNAKLRWELMRKYMNGHESCSVIMKKKCQKIYDNLSDSDKLLLELGEEPA